MKTLHQATVCESTYKHNVIMFHHVVPNAKAICLSLGESR